MSESCLWLLHHVSVVEEQWFENGDRSLGAIIRRVKRYFIKATLFSAPDAESAYKWAVDRLAGDEDAHLDGPGERTVMYGLGINQLERLSYLSNELEEEATGGLWGLDVGSVDPTDIDASGVPRIRTKNELEAFRVVN